MTTTTTPLISLSLDKPARGLRRRTVLLAAGATAACSAGAKASAVPWPTGWVKPRPLAPMVALTDSQARGQTLRQRLVGRVTLVQLIFTGCGDTCPTQGLLFSQLALRHQARSVNWLSISVDVLSDTPKRLLSWQHKIGSAPSWQAAVPAAQDLAELVRFLRGGPAGDALHTTQAFGFDRDGQLAYRTGDSPPAALLDQLVDALLLA